MFSCGSLKESSLYSPQSDFFGNEIRGREERRERGWGGGGGDVGEEKGANKKKEQQEEVGEAVGLDVAHAR